MRYREIEENVLWNRGKVFAIPAGGGYGEERYKERDREIEIPKRKIKVSDKEIKE